MAGFMLLVAPMPKTMRRRVLHIIHTSPVVAQVKVGVRFTFFFILVLFMDCVNRMLRVQQEMAAAHEGLGGAGAAGFVDRSEVNVRRFYNQRNMYLCGFTLFLGLILGQTYELVRRLNTTEETLEALHEGSSTPKKGDPAGLAAASVEELRAMVETNEAEKKKILGKYGQLAGEYGQLVADGKVQMPDAKVQLPDVKVPLPDEKKAE